MHVSRRTLAAGAFLVLVLAGEVAGRWTIGQLQFAGHGPDRAHTGLDLWPAAVIGAKVGIALVLARLFWRLVRAHRVARGAEGVLRTLGRRPSRPRPALRVSWRAWLCSFAAMSFLYVLPTSTGEVTAGCWLLITPWLHTQALPVFAVVAVVVAVLWRTVSHWLADLERYGSRLCELIARSLRPLGLRWRIRAAVRSPRALFGLAFECRPPPLPV